MAQESRVKKSLLNARVNLIFYFLTLAVSFFSRKIFLDSLGADFVGLTGTLQNLLGFLNLAELGIGSAIGYVLYKPLFDHDEEKINEIISVFGYLYRWIGFIILGAGLIMGGFLPLIFPNTEFELGIIYFAYFSFLSSSLIGYFANYKQTLLGADQKNYVVTAYFQTANIIKSIIQMACAHYTGNYYLWAAIELSFGIIYSFILNWKIKQVYPWLKSEIRLGHKLFKKYPEVIKYTKQLFVHKIGTYAQFQLTPVLTYTFVSLQTVAYFGNYTIITDKLNILLDNILNSTGAGVGNLIAEGNKAKIIGVFWELVAVRFFVATVFITCLYLLLPPFIKLWIGEEYLLSESVLIILLINFFMKITRGATDNFLYGYGLFNDIWAPAVEAVIFVIVSITGGHFLGIEGILLGGTFSVFIIVWLWKPYFLYSKGFKEPTWKYWAGWLQNLVMCLISIFATIKLFRIIFSENYCSINWIHWIISGIVSVSISGIICLVLLLIISSGMRQLLYRMLSKYIKYAK